MSREKVLTAAVAQAAIIAAINLAKAFGLFEPTDEQMTALNAFLGIVLPVLFGLFVRQGVTPVEDPQLPEGTTVTTTSAGRVTGTTTV